MRNISIFLIPTLAFASIGNVRVEATNTQAGIYYTAPDENPCTVAVSESSSYSPLVHDVDPALFAGANSDTRSGSIVSNRERTFVAGRRTSDVAADGNLYSRALQAYTPHYFQITCGSDTATGTFTTANPPAGNTAVELPPFNAAGTFNYAWPTFSLTDRTQRVIDPMTGVQFGRVTLPGDRWYGPMANAGFNAVFDLSGQWTNPANANAASTTTLATCDTAVACSASSLLFLALNPTVFQPQYTSFGGWNPGNSVNDILLRAFGSGSDATSNDNRAIEACWSIDGQTCWSNTVELVLPTTAGKVTGPATYPQRGGSWGPFFAKPQFGSTQGTVNVAGNVVTETGTGAPNYFKLQWAPGSAIYIAGSSPTCANNYCTIASVQNATTLTIQQSLTLTGVTYAAMTTGLLVHKKTNSGAISASFNFDYYATTESSYPLDGATEMCSSVSDTASVDANGNSLGYTLPVRLCMIPDAGGNYLVYALFPTTGEIRFISDGSSTGPAGAPVADQFNHPSGLGVRTFTQNAFDPTDPRTFYFTQSVNGINGAGAGSIFKIRYTGNYQAFNSNYAEVNGADKLTYTNITPASAGKDVESQVLTAIPDFDTGSWGNFEYQQINYVGQNIDGHTYAAIFADPGAQDAPCQLFFFDLSTTPYATYIGKTDSFSDPSLRWAGCHTWVTAKQNFRLSAVRLYQYFPGRPFFGPYKLLINEVRRNGTWPGPGQDTSVAANYTEMCPDGVTNSCLYIRVAGEPCYWTPSVSEAAKYPCPWNASYSMLQPSIIGDWFADIADQIGERLKILSKTPYSAGLELAIQRFANSHCTGGEAHSNGWTPSMVPSFTACSGTISVLSPPYQSWMSDDDTLTHNHGDMGLGITPGYWTTVGWPGDVRYNQPISAIGNPGNLTVGMTATKFASLQPSSGYSQSYISKRQWTAPLGEQNWILDLRSLNPNAGTGAESPANIAANTLTAIAGTSQVYRISVAGGTVDPKRISLFGYAGPFLLQEISNPSTAANTITDATPWTFCVANVNGECRTTSTAGQVFVSVPNTDIPASGTGCYTDQYARRIPCVISLFPQAAWTLQWDVSANDRQGTRFRKLSMAFSGPARQYDFMNARSDPDGKWFLAPGMWLGGKRQEVLLGKLPPWPTGDSQNRATFLNVPVQIGAIPAGTTNAVVEFGYDTNFDCTARQETCVAASATINEAIPFYWASDITKGAWNGGGVACGSGCTIPIPALSGRVLYYRVKYRNASNSVIHTGATNVLATN